MSGKTELLPCPFCGSEYTQVRWLGFKDKSNGAFESGFRGECTECFALTRAFSTEAEAIAAWNARAELGSEPPYNELIRYLENDWHISASWDGLRKFWCVELTEEGVRMRDARAEHGTLTAEHVREVIERHVKFYEGGDYDEQAIADELNARAERTCKSTTDDNAWCFVCSECGKSFPRSNLHLAHNHGEINYCPNCGARRVDA